MDLFAIILFFWARWLRKQPGTPSGLRYAPPLIVAAFLISSLGTVLGLLYAFESVKSVEPALKATHLANGITVAMRFTAAGIVFDVVMLVTLIVLTLRRSVPASPENPHQ
jgi:hypothetical protein